MNRALAGLSLILAVTFMTVPAALPTPAMAATGDRTVTLTLKCTNKACQGGWNWYQAGTLIGSGSLSGTVDATTTGTTTQPAAADEVELAVGAGAGCGTNQFDTFTPGSAINFTVILDVKSKTGGETCSRSSFNMKS